VSDDYDGLEAIDRDGTSIGKVERTYVDDSNTPRYVEVKFGALLPKHRLIPTADADLTDDGRLHVPFGKNTIEGSPDAPNSDTLESADLERIDSYYAGTESDEAVAAEIDTASASGQSRPEEATDEHGDTSLHQFEVVDESARGLEVGDQVPAGMQAPITDRGDVVEVPVLEEVLVKKTVVREILRVKKSDVVEQETVEGDVRKEVLELDDPSGAISESGVGTSSR
jgi:hypothetical protein